MKKLKIVSIIILIITGIILLINTFITKLPDTIIRINGIFMLISIFSQSYITFKSIKK